VTKIVSKIFLVFFLMLFLPVFAQAEIGQVNEPYVLWATIFNGSDFFNADAAYVSIYSPNQTLFIDNDSMTNVQIGTFIYNFTPNEIGNWLAYATFYLSGSPIATAAQGFTVTEFGVDLEAIESEFSMIGIMLGLVALIAFLVFIGIKMSQPAPGIPETDPSNESRRYVGTLFYFFAVLVFLVILFILMESATGAAYFGVLKALFIVAAVLFGGISTVGILIVFFLLFYSWFKQTARS
jgi:hypothetical protein